MTDVVVVCAVSMVALAGAVRAYSAQQSPSIVTQLSASTIQAGGFVYDTASLDGAVASAGGTVTYSYFTNDTCTANRIMAGTVNVVDGAIPSSASVTFTSAGNFFWQAVYSGDSNDVGTSSPCTVSNHEELTVIPSPSSSTTTTTPPTTTTTVSTHHYPSIGILKLERVGPDGQFTRGPLTGTVGETIFYEMIVRNTGDTTLSVTPKDPVCDSGTIIPRGVQVITPGHVLIYLCLHELMPMLSGDYVLRNTATVIGVSPQGVKVGPVRSSVVIRVKALPPAPKPKPVPKPASFTG